MHGGRLTHFAFIANWFLDRHLHHGAFSPTGGCFFQLSFQPIIVLIGNSSHQINSDVPRFEFLHRDDLFARIESQGHLREVNESLGDSHDSF